MEGWAYSSPAKATAGQTGAKLCSNTGDSDGERAVCHWSSRPLHAPLGIRPERLSYLAFHEISFGTE